MQSKQWIFIFQSFCLMLLLGTVYVWGVLRVEVEVSFSVNATLSGLPYMVSLMSYAGAMFVAGQWMQTHRKLMVLIGVSMVLAGLFLSSLAISFLSFLLTYGLLLGGGVGLLYGIPLWILQKNTTQHVGLYSGLILMGFGLSTSIMTPLVSWLLSFQTLAQTLRVIAWIAVGVFALTVWPLLQTTKNDSTIHIKTLHYSRRDFRALYLVFVLSLISGLTVIGLSYRIGVINYQFDETFVTIAIAIFALLNGFSRPFFGKLVDRFGFFKIAFYSLMILVLSGLLSFLNGGRVPWIYALSFGVFWFGLGNWMALMPLAIKAIFPKELFAKLYGLLFTSYGVAALVGTLFSGAILDLTQVTWPIYAFIVVANFVNLFQVLWLQKRRHLNFLQ